MQTPCVRHHQLRRYVGCALAAALAAQSQGARAQEAAPAGLTAGSANSAAPAETPAEAPAAEPEAEPKAPTGAETPPLMEVPTDATPAERMAAGKALYAQRRYVEAARIFESITTVNALYNAAASRAAAGHNAHALLLWTRYLEVAPDDERAEVQESIDATRKLTTELQFARSADAAGPRTLALRAAQHITADELRILWPAGQATLRASLDPGRWSAALEGAKDGPRSLNVTVAKGAEQSLDLAPELPLSPVRLQLNPARALRRGVTVTWSGPDELPERRVTTPETSQWQLAPGRWQLVASAPGYATAERMVEVTARPVELAISLKWDRESRARLGLGVGLGAAALGLTAAGGALLGSAGRTADALSDDGVLPPDEQRKLPELKQQSLAGNLLLSAGVGTAVVALTSGLTRGRKILAIEAGLGSALVLAGGLWLGLQISSDPFGEEPTRRDLDDTRQDIAVGGLLMGAGLGLMVPAIVAILTRRAVGRQHRRVAGINASMSMRGVSLQGVF